MRKGWTTKRLGEVGTFERGGGFLKSDYVDDGFPCIHYGQIHTTFGVSTHHHLTCIPEELAKFKSKLAKNGDVIIAITSEDVEGSCKCTAWLGGYDVAVGGHTAIFRHNLNPTFVSYYFRGRHYSLAKEKYAHGFKVVEIKPADIAKIDISYPSLSEQERIVAELDLLQGIIDKQKAQLKELDTLAQSIFYDMFGDPKLNDKDWKTELFKDTFRLKSGDGLPEKEFIEGNIPVFGGNGISGYHSSFNKEGKHIIVGRVGAYCGNVRFVQGQFWLTDNAFDAFFSLDTLDYWFACYLLNSVDLHKFANHAAQPVISNVGLKDIQIILPPLTLQQAFATKIEAIERQKASINASIDETQKLFDYTMDKYFG